ncbi:MAG TPA: hypothetical protein VMQ76_04950 [Terracidiphilus sp.]|nr:hypothetical protein [Terracidiphilus sp.]
MPKDTKAAVVVAAPLPAVPSWAVLKADAGFQAWHASPYLRMMTAALRASYPFSAADQPHTMIHAAGAQQGWLEGLTAIDKFCTPDEKPDTAKEKKPPYAPATPTDD